MSAALVISDDLRGVLEDLAASPKQVLFGGTLLQRVGLAMQVEPTAVSPSQTGLSNCERHLVAMHRRELARVLNQAFYADFFRPGGPAGLFFAKQEPRTRQAWEADARFARDHAPHEAFKKGTARWLHRLLNGKPLGSAQDIQGLLYASLRLVDSPQTHLFSGISHQVLGNGQAALAVLGPLSKRAPERPKLTALRAIQSIAVESQQMNSARRLALQTLKELDRSNRGDEVPAEVAALAYRHAKYSWDTPLPRWVLALARNQADRFEHEYKRIQVAAGPAEQSPWLSFGDSPS